MYGLINRCLKKNLINFKNYLILLLFSELLLSGISIGLPYISGLFINSLIQKESINIIFIYTGIFSFLSLLSILMSFAVNNIKMSINTKVSYNLNRYIIENIHKWDFLEFQKFDNVYLTQRINSDSNLISNFYIDSLPNLIINIIIFSIMIFLIYKLNTTLFISIILLILVYIVTYLFYKQKLYNLSIEYREKQSRFFSILNNQITDFEFIKTNSFSDKFLSILDSSFWNLFNSIKKYQSQNYKFISMDNIISTISKIIIFSVSGYLISKDFLKIGDFVIINSYLIYIIELLKVFFQFGKQIQDLRVSLIRTEELLNIKKECSGNKNPQNINQIKLINVYLKLGKNYILKNLNFTLKKGLIYGIIGSNGTGKTTLIRLLTGLYNDQYKGVIKFGQYELRDINLDILRKNIISVSLQNPVLSGETLDNNFDKETLTTALKFLNEFDLKMDIKTENNFLSGGEKQKVSIIRSILKKYNILLLDEPTSFLDINSKGILKNKIKELSKNKIVLIITHDKEIIEFCDKVIEI